MSAPLLTPLESPSFDEDLIADLEEHFDDDPMCVRGDARAAVRLATRCCGSFILLCARHIVQNRAAFPATGTAKCRTCGHESARASFDDVYRVVRL